MCGIYNYLSMRGRRVFRYPLPRGCPHTALCQIVTKNPPGPYCPAGQAMPCCWHSLIALHNIERNKINIWLRSHTILSTFLHHIIAYLLVSTTHGIYQPPASLARLSPAPKLIVTVCGPVFLALALGFARSSPDGSILYRASAFCTLAAVADHPGEDIYCPRIHCHRSQSAIAQS